MINRLSCVRLWSIAVVLVLFLSDTSFAEYQLTQLATAQWHGTIADRLQPEVSGSYQFDYGQEGTVSFTLPWPFHLNGVDYTEIIADTSGNIWFDTPGSGARIAAWNTDLNPYYQGGVFIQHETSPERVVIQWMTETSEHAGYARTNNFEAVLSQDGTIVLNYQAVSPFSSTDLGSGIFDGTMWIHLPTLVPNLSGTSFVVTETFDTDGVADSLDAFPADIAASIDSDGDGYPDQWNDGYGQSDSTTGLALDADPNDPDVWIEGSFLYYPHIASIGEWETEIGLINTGSTQLQGTLSAYSGTGVTIETKLIDLPVRGRISYVVGDFFTEHEQIAYMKFVADSSTASGYEKFYQLENRVAIPAVSRINQEIINISHIASGNGWWTGIALVNTTSEEKTMTFTFSDDSQYHLILSAGAHWAGTVAGLSGIDGVEVASAQITGAQGVIGLELFGGLESSYLSGILLDDQASTSLYYSHVASNATWWTGIVCYNPGTEATQLTLSPYNSDGVLLSSSLIDIAAKEKYVGLFQGLNLPTETAWFELESTSPVTGFELFGTNNGMQLAGYTAVNIGRMTGSFAELEQDGWTGIAFVNASSDNALVTLTALSDSGSIIATTVLNLSGNEMIVDIAESLFAEDISSATYITFSSNHEVVGFQLNGSTDGTMLDGLPGI